MNDNWRKDVFRAPVRERSTITGTRTATERFPVDPPVTIEPGEYWMGPNFVAHYDPRDPQGLRITQQDNLLVNPSQPRPHPYESMAREILGDMPGCDTLDCSCCAQEKIAYVAAALQRLVEQQSR